MQGLSVNNDFLSAGGVISRKNYFFSFLKLLGCTFLSYGIIIGSVFIPQDVGGQYAGWAIYGVATIALTYFSYVNTYKRLRDIRGTTDGQIGWQIGTTIALIVPLVNIITMGILLFKKGKITGGAIPSAPTPMDYQNAA